jgi:hypothetical protein
VIKGQYEGYQSVAGVAPGSSTETYAAVRLAAETWRWAGVPIVIRVGKCLPVTATEVMIDFKPVPHDVFGLGEATTTSNALRFRIYPESQAVLTLVGKKPGAGWEPEVQDLTFIQHPGADMRAYDRLIGAALNGERRTRWKRPGGSSTRSSAPSGRSCPTQGVRGARTRPGCSRRARPGTTHRPRVCLKSRDIPGHRVAASATQRDKQGRHGTF